MKYWENRLVEENIETTEENIFIAAACDEKGISFLKGNSPLSVRKNSLDICEDDKDCKLGENKVMGNSTGNYTVVVDGQKFNVTVAEGNADIQVTPVQNTTTTQATAAPVSSGDGVEVGATVSGNVWKITKNVGDKVAKGEVVAILEAMKMEIDVEAPVDGTIKSFLVSQSEAVEEGQVIAIIG